jgi:hypothetical protein
MDEYQFARSCAKWITDPSGNLSLLTALIPRHGLKGGCPDDDIGPVAAALDRLFEVP